MALDLRALIFDLDGVVTDTAEYHFLAWKRMADEEGLPFTRSDNEALRGVSRRESLNRILKGKPIEDNRAAVLMQRKTDYYLAYLENLTPADRLPGVTELLNDARTRGLKLAIASASRNARQVLDRLGLSTYFDAVGDGYSVQRTKPAPDLFVWVAGRLGVYPQEAVVFEDAEAGIDAALEGRFWTVGVGASNVTHAHITIPDMRVSLDTVLEQLNETVARTTPG